MKYIKGDRCKGEEIIAMLESLGGRNIWQLEGFDPTYLYYIDEDSNIGCVPSGTYDYIQALKNGTELKLSEVEVIMPKNIYWFEVPKTKYDFNILFNELKKITKYCEKELEYKYLNIGDIVVGSETNGIMHISRLTPIYVCIKDDMKLYGAELRIK